MRLWYLSHRRPAKAQAHMKYGSRRRVRPKIRHLSHWMAAHASLKNEFTEDEKYHNLMSWLIYRILGTNGLIPYTINQFTSPIGPRQANLVLIAYASSEGSGEPAHPRSLARTSAARSYKQ